MQERIEGIIRRWHRGEKGNAPQAAIAAEVSKQPLEYVSSWNDLMHRPVDPDPQNKPIDQAKIPSFEQLGSTISRIFGRSSQAAYKVDPTRMDWLLPKAQSINVQFDKNRPRKFDVELVFASEDGEETTEVSYSIDTTRKTMDWEYAVDPMLPENSRIANLRALLLAATQTILEVIEGQSEAQYQIKIATRATPIVEAKKAKRERFDDPIYALRKENRKS